MASKSSHAQSLGELANLFDMLSDKTRLRIVLLLAAGERNVGNLGEELKLGQPMVCNHLGLLRMNRVIIKNRRGKKVFYTLDPVAGRVVGGKIKFQCEPYSVTIEGF